MANARFTKKMSIAEIKYQSFVRMLKAKPSQSPQG